MPVTTDFAGTETLAETKSRLGTLLTAYGYDSSGYSTWGDARTDLNSALTAIQETTISDGELASSFRPKLNALNALSDYPAGGKVPNLVFDFEGEYYRANDTETTFGDSITFSRASSATYVDSDGVLQTAASGVPRIGHHVYNGTSWVNEGLLHESEARTNLLTYSEDFTDAAWFGLNTATLAIDATGPDGETSAVTLVDSGATGSGSVSLTETVTVATLTAYTFSVFAKADQLSWVALQARNFTTPSDGQAFFSLSDGTVGTTGAGYTASVQDFGNGWYRCSITFTTDASDTSGALDIRVATADNNAACDLDGTSSILIYGAQFEAGPTPSSYIPTNGSTATRAAETLTIPAAKLPWPTPNVIGPELVTNGTFDTDTTGWTSGSGATLSSVDGQLNVATAIGDTFSNAYQSFTTEVGKVYRVTATKVSQDQNSTWGVSTTPLSTRDLVDFGSTTTGTQTGFFVATSTTTYVQLWSGDGSDTSAERVAVYDNISVREIDPLSVSIQVDGRMTYADTDQDTEVRQFNWNAGSGNYIIHYLQTNGTRTGLLRAAQNYNGTFDSSASPDTYLSPGVLVPYNFSSRHGSTFVQAAADGSLFSADTDPVALPDLSSTDLDLGEKYMGTIRTLRMWDQDIGDSGIEEASA